MSGETPPVLIVTIAFKKMHATTYFVNVLVYLNCWAFFAVVLHFAVTTFANVQSKKDAIHFTFHQNVHVFIRIYTGMSFFYSRTDHKLPF